VTDTFPTDVTRLRSPIAPLSGKTYVASAGVNREAARAFADRLRDAGHIVTSTWHEADPFDSANDKHLSRDQQRLHAETCIVEVQEAANVVVLAHPGGRGHVFEAGYAMGLGKNVVWFGEVTTLFAAVCIDGAALEWEARQ
jgi:nucleoside 2-deoxyribosyltransferase